LRGRFEADFAARVEPRPAFAESRSTIQAGA
jgi:hypothetical protein